MLSCVRQLFESSAKMIMWGIGDHDARSFGAAATQFDGPFLALSGVLAVVYVVSGIIGFCLMLGMLRWATPRWYRDRARR
jgi:hypothetical protein